MFQKKLKKYANIDNKEGIREHGMKLDLYMVT